jgi:hypothetical protein
LEELLREQNVVIMQFKDITAEHERKNAVAAAAVAA